MNLETAETMARTMIAQHLEGWAFKWDNASRRFGMCRGGARVIQLSRKLVALNEEGRVRETVLHEIAHALAGCSHGHDWVWRSTCARIGLVNASRCFTEQNTVTPTLKYHATCSVCGEVVRRGRRPRRAVACSACCRRHNFGRYSAAYQLTFTA